VPFFNKKAAKNLIVCAIDGQQCRLNYFDKSTEDLILSSTTTFEYAEEAELAQNLQAWCKQNVAKGAACRWLLSHDLYQTYNVDKPSVDETEMAQALKWQIKDQLDFPVDAVLLCYYQPNHPDPQDKQLVAVTVEKKLVESLITLTHSVHLTMESIEIEELAIGQALLPYLGDGKIVGYVGEDNSGLVFNFYLDNQLCFTRHKKGRFMPKTPGQEFSLEADDAQIKERETQQENFLLETQRTLDYVISQLFRKPIDKLLLLQRLGSGESGDNSAGELLQTLQQLTDTPVSLVTSEHDLTPVDENLPTLAELGCATRVEI